MLAAGACALVEKPLATTLDEAQQLIEFSGAGWARLMVGHIERCQQHHQAPSPPGHRATQQNLPDHARRLGPFPSRIHDVGVIMDLATHDLDIMRFLTHSEAVTASSPRQAASTSILRT